MSESNLCELSFQEAVDAFESMPASLQLASLHPQMLCIDSTRDPLLRPVFWSFQSGNARLLHNFHIGDNPTLDVKDIQSPYGYGGPLSNSDDADFVLAADAAFARWARDKDIIAEFLRFHPLVPHSQWYLGQIDHNRETVYVDLTRDLFDQYQARRRTDVRRSINSGLRISKVSPALMGDVFPSMYEQNMRQICASPDYYFPLTYFSRLLEFRHSECWLAYVNETPVAGAVFLLSPSARVVEYHLAAMTPGQEQSKPIVGLLHAACSHYSALSYRCMYLGGGRSRGPDDTLLYFKKGFSRVTASYQIGSRVFDGRRYGELKQKFPVEAQSKRVLFYKT